METGGRSREGNRLGSAVSFSEVPPMSLAQSSEAQSRLVANKAKMPKRAFMMTGSSHANRYLMRYAWAAWATATTPRSIERSG